MSTLETAPLTLVRTVKRLNKRRIDLRKRQLLSVIICSLNLDFPNLILYPQAIFMDSSVFVTVYARLFLESVSCILPDTYDAQCCIDYLEESTFFEDLDNIIECFDKTTKLRFRNSDEPQYIKFGGAKDNDKNYNIRFGQLKLLGSDVASFFEPSVECIVNSVLHQCKVSHKPISVSRFCFLCYALP